MSLITRDSCTSMIMNCELICFEENFSAVAMAADQLKLRRALFFLLLCTVRENLPLMNLTMNPYLIHCSQSGTTASNRKLT